MSSYYPTFDYSIRHQQYDSYRANDDTVPIVKLAHAIEDIVTDVTPHFEFTAQTNLTFNVIVNSLLLLIVFIIVLVLIINTVQELNQKFNLLGFFQRMFTIIENEFSVPRSLMVIIMLLTSCLLLGSLSPLFSIKTPLMVYMLIVCIAMLLLTILL